jgi:hypothetical protein
MAAFDFLIFNQRKSRSGSLIPPAKNQPSFNVRVVWSVALLADRQGAPIERLRLA